MLLSNVRLSWAKLDKMNPDMGFSGDTPQYSINVATSNKSDADAWSKAGLNVKPTEVDGAIEYQVRLKKKIWKDDDGKVVTPPPAVVDAQLQPIEDVNSIGNGSEGNVQIAFKPYDFQGKKGISVKLMAIQVAKLVKYEGGSNTLEFTAINTDTDDII